MKYIYCLLIALLTSMAHAGANYSGIWKDQSGTLYSIHQRGDNVVMAELQYAEPSVIPPNTQGNIRESHKDLDLAISGKGFFILQANDGSFLYTRNGHFFLSADSAIIDGSGARLVTEQQRNVPISEGTGGIVISPDGKISLFNAITKEQLPFDRIVLASIANEQLIFTGYPIQLSDQKAVTRFYPDTNRVNIQQSALEDLTYIYKHWLGYYGNITGNSAKLTLDEKLNEDGDILGPKTIIFDSDTAATIKTECLLSPRWVCEGNNSILQDVKLTKIY